MKTPKTGDSILKRVFVLLSFILLSNLAGIIGALFTITGVGSWYQEIAKPSWNPPGWVFGPVWTTLYILMGIAAFIIWDKRNVYLTGRAFLYFGIQLALNTLWSIIFFGMHNPGLAFIEILILLLLIILTTREFFKIDSLAGVLMVPYIAWVSFASVLNFTIWMLN